MASLYNSREMLQLAAEDYPDASGVESAFDKAIKWLHGKRIFGAGMMKEKPVRRLMEETAAYLAKGIERGIMEEQPTEAMAASLRESAGVFSGFKTFHEMKEAAGLLLDEQGNLKPFEQFSKDVQTINDAYNRHYLRTEYNFTVQSAQMAARWEEQQDDGGGRYLLQYRTAGDSKVRESHRKLEGITLPASDPFWDKYYPPNGFNCRCTVAKVRAAKYPATDSKEAMRAGDDATAGKYAEMFRFNPGKQRAAYPAYNSYTIAKCATCKKNGFSLAKVPSNELCAACPIIREMAKTQDNLNDLRKSVIKNAEKRQLKSDKLRTGIYYQTRKSLKRGLGHAYTKEEVQMQESIHKHLDKLRFIRVSPLGEVKDMSNPKDVKNLQAKIDRGVTGYNIYEMEKEGVTWVVKTEVYKNWAESVYLIKRKE